MISIINYDSVHSNEIVKMLIEFDLEYRLLTEEVLICKADTIILPDCCDIQRAMRKMQLLNISNVLKIINKKIIGINNGMFLMCSGFFNTGNSGLGFFHSDVYNYEHEIESNLNHNHVKSTKHGCDSIDLANYNFFYKSKYYILSNDNTCVQSKIEDKKISILDRTGQYIGINVDLKADREKDKELLKMLLK